MQESYLEGFPWKGQGNRNKLILERFLLDTRGRFFTLRKISHWNTLSRDVVDSQHWALLRFRWAGCWATLSRPHLCHEWLDQMIHEVPSKAVFCDSIYWVMCGHTSGNNFSVFSFASAQTCFPFWVPWTSWLHYLGPLIWYKFPFWKENFDSSKLLTIL